MTIQTAQRIPYVIEADADLKQYTPDQLGEPVYQEMNPHSGDRYDLIVEDTNNQVEVLRAASWYQCRARVHHMLKEGVDLSDIYGVPCKKPGKGTQNAAISILGPGLSNATKFLWHVGFVPQTVPASIQEG